MLSEITPLILTYNEAANIGRSLERVAWASEIVVVDSFSTDATPDIVASFPGARILQRRFDTFAQQCNFALAQVSSPWVLSLDADYVLSDALIAELRLLTPESGISGYRAAFRYCIGGRPLRGTLYPPRTVLYRRQSARYYDEGHGHRVQISGRVSHLHGAIYHDDRKPLDRWLADQNRYMIRECRHLRGAAASELNAQDRLRRCVVVAPALVFVYTLIAKGLVLDGWRGWFYVCQRTIAELILSLRLAESRLWPDE